MEPEALGREMLANYRHREVRAVLPAEFPRQREAPMAGAVGAPAHLGQQRLPFVTRQAAALEIGARPFPPMVEEADIIVLAFERLYLALDEIVELREIGRDLCRDLKIHRGVPT